MVQLDLESPVSSEFALTKAWDMTVRKHYGELTRDIEGIRTALQRTKRYFLSLAYPAYSQNNLLNLSILNKRRDLGAIDSKELDMYEQVEPSIRAYYSQTFGGKLLFPATGLVVGVALFAALRLRNTSVPVSLFGLVMPAMLDYMRLENSGLARNKTNEFLQWLIEYRRAKCVVEVHGKNLRTAEFKKHFGDSNASELFEQYENLLRGK